MRRSTTMLLLVGLLFAVASPSRAQAPIDGPPMPPGFLIAPLPEANASDPLRAYRPFDEVLDALLAMDDVPEPRAEPAPPEALRRYVSGRERLLAGDANGAARDFYAAAQIDPLATAPNEALGELLLRGGVLEQGLDAYRRAVDAGATSPTVLLDVANAELRAGNAERAAVLLARGLESPLASPEARGFARPLLLERLDVALDRLGWLRASIDAGDEALRKIALIDAGTTSPALARLRAGLGDKWASLGDRSITLGDVDAAQDYYELAANAGGDWMVLAPRRVWAFARAGDLNAAVDTALPPDQPHRLASGLTVALLEWLLEAGADCAAITQRIDEAASSWPSPTPMLETRLAIAGSIVSDTPVGMTLALSRALERTPRHRGLHRAIADRYGSLVDLADAMHQHPRAARGLARAWLDKTGQDSQQITRLDTTTDAGALAAAAAWLELGRPDLAADLLKEQPASLLQATALAGDTRWDAFEQSLSQLTDPAERAAALVAAYRYQDAAGAVNSAPDTAANRNARAQVAMLLGRPFEAVDLFDQSLSADAFDTHALEGLVVLCAPGAPANDPRKFEPALAALKSANPWDPLVIQKDTQRAVQFEGVAAALDHAIPLLDRAESVAGTVAEVALTGSEQDKQRAISALTIAHEASPSDGRVLAPLIVLLLQTGATEQARALADAFTGSSTDIEDIAESLGAAKATDAPAYRAEPLAKAPRTVERTLRLAETLVRDDPSQAAELVERALTQRMTLPTNSYAALMRTLLTSGQLAEREASVERADQTLAMIAIADAASIKPAWQIRLVGFSAAVMAKRDDPAAVSASVRALVQAIDNREDAQRLAQQYRGARADVGASITQARAEVAYALAGALYFEGLIEAAMGAYRIALELNPDHVWANNDLGYFLTQEGGRLDEAAPLIERAYAQRPDEINILDSLAWLRYLQGRLEDDSRGPGAITLFDRALEREDGRTNDTVQQQAGDVFWAAGDKDRAIAAWEEALKLLDAMLAQAPEGSAVEARWQEQRTGLVGRLDRARSGGDPLETAKPPGD